MKEKDRVFSLLAALCAINVGVWLWLDTPINAATAVFIGFLALEVAVCHEV